MLAVGGVSPNDVGEGPHTRYKASGRESADCVVPNRFGIDVPYSAFGKG